MALKFDSCEVMDTKKLWKRLNETPKIAFSTGGEATELPAVPGLTIDGIGEVALPLSDNELLKRVLAQCRQAPYGRGMETLVDTTVRKTWQLEPSRFSFAHPDWNAGLQQLLSRVGKGMGCADGITCHVYKLLIYEAGGHFVFHRDTEKEPGMFATLVVQLPSRFTGGSLIVKHKKISLKYDFGCASGKAPFLAHFAAHFADVEHKVEEVLSGVRVAVVYNICWVESGPAPSVTGPHTSAFDVAAILSHWDLAVHSKLLFCLEHCYTKQSLITGLAALKGNDREKVNVLIDANNMLDEEKKLNIYLAIAERVIEYQGYDDERCSYGRGREQNWELSEDTVDITPWYDTTGSEFEAGEFVDMDIEEDSLNDVWVDDRTVEKKVEYTGNEGSTKTTVYHRCIVAFWPAAHEIALLLPRGGVRVGANILKSMASKCTDTTVPEQRAATEVKKFQSFVSDTLLPLLQQVPKEQVVSSLPCIGSSICQVSDIISAQRLMSQCIAKIGLCSDSVSSTIVSIGDKFGWAEIASFVLPLLLIDLQDYQFSYGVELFVKLVEGNPMLLEDHKLKRLGSQLICALSRVSPEHTWAVLSSVAKVCLILKDCSLARKFLSHISRVGICSNDTANAVVALFHQFGIEAFVDLIPGAFSVLTGAEEGTCSLLATLLREHHNAYLDLLIPIVQRVLKHVVNTTEKQHVDCLISITSELKCNLPFCRQLLADMLLPIGLGPCNSMISDAVISISCNIGWPATKDIVPAFFQNLTSFCAEAYQSLLAFALKEDHQVGVTCCAILAQKAFLVTLSSSLPAKDAASLIVQVFFPLANIDALTKFVSNVLQHTDSKFLPILIAGLRANLPPQLLQTPPLLSIIMKRKTDIAATITAIPSPSWSVPNESTMPRYHQPVVTFLKSNLLHASLTGFSNIADARKFVSQYQGKLPVIMKEGGVGSRAHVVMSRRPESMTDMLHHETRLQLQAELKELCELVPAQHPARVGSSETAVAPAAEVAISSPSSKSKVSLCRKPLVPLVETVPSRETILSTPDAKRIKKEQQL